MYGFSDLFSWQNLVNPAALVSLRPAQAVRVDAFYRLYWLASPRDALVRIGVSDPTGSSGAFVGQEVDVGVRWSVFQFTEIEIQYREPVAGGFLDRTAVGRGTRVFFVSLVVGTGGR